METLRNIKNRNASQSRIRLGLILAGIATALLCSLALMNDDTSWNRAEANLPQLLEAPKMASGDLVNEFTNMIVIPAVW